MVEAVKDQMIYTKVVELTPKYIIVNKSAFYLELKQPDLLQNQNQQNQEILAKIGPHDRTPLYWRNCNKKFTVQIRQSTKDQSIKDDWTNEIRLDTLETVDFFSIITSSGVTNNTNQMYSQNTGNLSTQNIQQQQQQKQGLEKMTTIENQIQQQTQEQKIKYFRIQKTKLNAINIVVLSCINSNQHTYLIQNDCTNFKIKCSQLINKPNTKNNKKNIDLNQVNEQQQQENIQNKYETNINQLLQQNDKYYYTIDPKQNTPFYWQYPNLQNKEIEFQLEQISDKQEQSEYKNFKETFILNTIDIYQNKKITLKSDVEGETITLIVDSVFDDQSKIIKFQEDLTLIEKNKQLQNFQTFTEHFMEKAAPQNIIMNRTQTQFQQDQQHQNSNTEDNQNQERIYRLLTINIRKLGISLVGYINNTRKEINYIQLHRCHIYGKKLEKNREVSLSVHSLQLDNNTDINTLTPVQLTATQTQKLQKNHNLNFLQAKLDWNHTASQIFLINCFESKIMPFTLKLDEEYMRDINAFFNKIKNMLDNDNLIRMGFLSKNFNTSNYIFSSKKNKTRLNQLLKEKAKKLKHFENIFQFWKMLEIPEVDKFMYMTDIKFPSLNFDLSFYKKIDQFNEKGKDFFFQTLGNALGSAVTNIENAPINLVGFQKQQFFGTSESIVPEITQYYKKELYLSFFKIIGAFQIIGNPAGLVRRLGAGLGDIVQQPYEQTLQHGPMGFGLGVAYGTGSLVKNTIAGSCNSVNNLTDSISSGVSKLTFDNKYLEKRRRFMLQKPKHIFDGMQQATLSLYYGIEGGITGVFTKPYEGAKSDGLKGFAQGTIKGVTGVVTKPIAGVLDATAKTAEGFSQTVTHFEDKPSEIRIREPRVFYDIQQYYKSYDNFDCQAQNFLYSYKNGIFADQQILLLHILNQEDVLLLTQGTVFILEQNISNQYQEKFKIKLSIQAECLDSYTIQPINQLDIIHNIQNLNQKIVIKLKEKSEIQQQEDIDEEETPIALPPLQLNKIQSLHIKKMIPQNKMNKSSSQEQIVNSARIIQQKKLMQEILQDQAFKEYSQDKKKQILELNITYREKNLFGDFEHKSFNLLFQNNDPILKLIYEKLYQLQQACL